jgi:hypothetical protein
MVAVAAGSKQDVVKRQDQRRVDEGTACTHR